MALLVTGAMGHVGLEVVRQAVRNGHRVVAAYRNAFHSGDAAEIGPLATWVRADLSNPIELDAVLAANRVQGAIHTAAVPNDNVARGDPLSAVYSNVVAVAGLLEHARRDGWQRLINVSTGSVFQDATNTDLPVLEDRATAVDNIYSTTKLCGELLTTMYASQLDVSAATIRISWVYGPPLVPAVRDHPRGPIPWFLRCALSGAAVDDPSGGDFLASYTHVSDVAAGLLAAYEASQLRHSLYHLGSGHNLSTSEVVRAVKSAVPEASITVGPGTAPYTDHTRMRGPLAGERLYQDTGFRPRLDLEQGVATFADWMRANRSRWAAEGTTS